MDDPKNSVTFDDLEAMVPSAPRPAIPMSEVLALGRELYSAYCESSGGKNFRGEPCPPWEQLPTAICLHWCATADYVLRRYRLR